LPSISLWKEVMRRELEAQCLHFQTPVTRLLIDLRLKAKEINRQALKLSSLTFLELQLT
jgi:hypothetical protein